VSIPQQPPARRSRLPRLPLIFGLAFLLSSLCLLVSSAFLFLPGNYRPPTPSPPILADQTPAATDEPNEVDPSDPAPSVAAAPSTLGVIAGAAGVITSCFTALTTFVGFVVTTVWGLRKERRESRHADLEGKLREIELERQKLELERLRRQHSGSDQDTLKRK
jgi:hypothetical protein